VLATAAQLNSKHGDRPAALPRSAQRLLQLGHVVLQVVKSAAREAAQVRSVGGRRQTQVLSMPSRPSRR